MSFVKGDERVGLSRGLREGKRKGKHFPLRFMWLFGQFSGVII